MKRPTKIVLTTIAIVAVLAAIVWANISRLNSQVGGIEIVVDYAEGDTLVKAEDLQAQLIGAMPDLLTRLVKDVDMDAVKQAIERSPYILETKGSISVGRKIVIHATQRRPIMRIFYGQKEFYLDNKGKLIPLSPWADCDVLVGNGFFRQRLTKNYESLDLNLMAEDSLKCDYDLVRLWQVGTFLDNNTKYGALFDQVYIDENGDIVLSPKVGNHIVILGNADNMDRKMENLWTMYQRGMQQTGWNTYNQISLKFGDLVICTRRK